MNPAIGYVRVSTLDQAANGVSLDAQESRIKGWAQSNGYELVAICRDNGISGGTIRKRPGIQEATTLACRHHAPLVVYSLSRVARSTKDAIQIGETLSKAHADLVSLSEDINTTTAAGKMIFRLLAVLAEFERDLVSERTRSALAHMKANGKRTGLQAPYGSRLDGNNVVKNPAEQAILLRIRSMAAQGLKAPTIAKALNNEGIPTRHGRPWNYNVVHAILQTTTPAPTAQ
jgi:site-specific DNA recombinase